MDYQKLDASLAAALERVKDPATSRLAVFIRTERPPGPPETAFLARLGVRTASADSQVFTATLPPSAIGELSEQPWVRYLELSQQLRTVHES